jgi:hypothetical protein
MKLDRNVLFEQVWATPMSKLCKAYGMTDQGLRKACVKLQIPLPQRGHWAKIAAGYQIARPNLLPYSDADLSKAAEGAVRKAKSRSPAAAPVSVGAIEAPAAPLKLAQLHVAIRVVLPEFDTAAEEALLWKRKFDWEQDNPGKTYRGMQPRFGSWQYFADAGQLLRATHKRSFMRVSLSAYKRGFQLLNSLIEHLEQAGFSVELPKNRERLRATRDAATVSIRLAEKLEVGQRKELNSWSKEARFVRTLTPTGRLFIGIEQVGYGETQVADRSGFPLENRFADVMAAVEDRLQRSIDTQTEWARQRERSEERERVRQEEARLREVAKRAEEAEQARRQALLKEAKDWQQASTLRTYLAHLEERRSAGGQAMDTFDEWVSWANEVANQLDGSDARVAQAPSGSNDGSSTR